MRDLLSKLDAIVSETELKSPEDLQAKRKALQDLQMDPVAGEDPEIKQAIMQRKADLEKEAQAKGFDEGIELDHKELKPASDKGYSDASNGIDKNPFNPNSPAFKAYREGQMAYKRHFGESVFEVGDDFGISFSEDFEIETEIVGFLEDGIVVELDDTALNYLQENGINFLEGELTEGLRDPKDNPCWKGYKPVGTKKKGGRTVPNCVPKESIEENNPEYDDEAGMADNNIETMKRAVQGLDDLIQSGDNLPEWCQEKIAVAKNMLVAVWDYMQSEEQKESIETEAKYQGREVPLGKKMAGDVKKSKVYVRKPNGKVVKVNFGDKKMRIKKSNPARRKSFRARHNCKNPGPRWKARYWSCRSW